MAKAARLDVDSFLVPISEDAPAGPEREYDGDRPEIAEFFRAPPETVDSPEHTRPDASEVRQIVKQITAEGKLSHDLNLPVYYIRAGAGLGELTMLVDGVLWLDGLIENFWESLHPTIEDYDFDGRTAPLGELASPQGMLLNLDGVTAYAHKRLGTFTLHDLREIAEWGASATNHGALTAAIEDGGKEPLEEALELLTEFETKLREIDGKLGELAGGGPSSPNLGKLYEALNKYRHGFGKFLEVEPVAADPGDQPAGAVDSGAPAAEAVAPSAPGRVANRQDVIRSLDTIIDYYDQQEPGSPVPVALRKIRKWVNLDFLALLKEIAPDSLSSAKLSFRNDDENSGF